ncbi:2-keto-4-pentenoate hydratase [Variovorax ureilyticus]|uniref:2-keto-4-pentenoate hydratase n=1 Tax=Variovorax ureilyticus TaxID=1836198 RepID=UPI003D673EA1
MGKSGASGTRERYRAGIDPYDCRNDGLGQAFGSDDDAMQTTLVQALVDARRQGTQILKHRAIGTPANEEEACLTMLEVAGQLAWEPLGWKIAATNAEMQRRLRTTAPVLGRTFRRFLLHSPAVISHEGLLDPVVECEFFFRMGRELPVNRGGHTREQVVDCIASVHVGIEVAECRLAFNPPPDPLQVMADGYASGRYVMGPALPDWQAALEAPMAVVLEKNGAERARGSSSEVMGNPVNAVVWLANRLSGLGVPLARDEIISSGSCTGMVRAKAGDRMLARFGQYGTVEVAFD